MSLERAKRMLLVVQIAERDEQQLADKLSALRQQQHQELSMTVWVQNRGMYPGSSDAYKE